MIELVVYALLAAFIFSRLYGSLGKSTSLNLKKITSSSDIPNGVENTMEDIEEYIDSRNINLVKVVYEQILQKDKYFSVSHFMQGSSSAFELIIKYFNQGNLSKLRPLLDEDLYNDFVEKIKNRTEIHESIIVSIVSQKILEIKLVKNVVFIVVYFLSEQIILVKDKSGDIVSGSTSVINKVEDIWKFKKNITSLSPNWLLTSIGYEEDNDKNT